jgi:hypothetical protein
MSENRTTSIESFDEVSNAWSHGPRCGGAWLQCVAQSEVLRYGSQAPSSIRRPVADAPKAMEPHGCGSAAAGDNEALGKVTP